MRVLITAVATALLTLSSMTSASASDIHDAIKNGDHVKAYKIAKDRPEALEEANKNGSLPLHLAAYLGEKGAINLLIKAGADPGQTGKNGYTPLHQAVWRNHENTDVINTLVKAGADPEKTDEFGRTPLQHAASQGHNNANAINTLVDHGAPIEATSNRGYTALQEAAATGHKANIEALINRGADTQVRTEGGWTLLHLWAADAAFGQKVQHSNLRDQQLDAVLEAGINPNTVDNTGRTALHTFVRQRWLRQNYDVPDQWPAEIEDGLPDLAKRLAAVTDLSRRDDVGGWTPLHLAIRTNVPSIARALIESGAPADIQNDAGDTPFDLALENDYSELANLMYEN